MSFYIDLFVILVPSTCFVWEDYNYLRFFYVEGGGLKHDQGTLIF